MSSSILNKKAVSKKGLLYTQMKIFHFHDKVESLPKMTKRIEPPIHIRIKPTNVCNHNCGYCAYKADGLQLGKDMVQKDYIPREKMLEIIDDIADMGVRAVTFSGGGEPFCYPYLAEVAKKISGSNVRFASLTNGSRLEGEAAEIFAEYGAWLRVSIDGWDSESYSSYRNVPSDEFDKVMGNIRHFKRLGGKCFLGASIIVDSKNGSHLHELVVKLKDAGVDSVKVSPCIVSNSGKENNEYHMGIFKTVKAEIARAQRDLSSEDFEIFDAYHQLDEKFYKNYNWCPYLQILPVIGADLNIYPCQDKAYNIDEALIGTIKDKSFRDFWYSDKTKFFKIDPSVVCNHHCVANSKNKMILEYLDADVDHLGFV